jgi:AAA15 family ATPase/GTPase
MMGTHIALERNCDNGAGYLMATSIDIRNFRCFDHVAANDCRRINILVGENGSGKTALLESIILVH